MIILIVPVSVVSLKRVLRTQSCQPRIHSLPLLCLGTKLELMLTWLCCLCDILFHIMIFNISKRCDGGQIKVKVMSSVKQLSNSCKALTQQFEFH